MKCDLVVIGGGIVGLAFAYTMLRHRPGMRLLLLEKENGIARHQTGHNSGVIHSGIYYKPGSKKALTCRRGAQLLREFCAEHAIPIDNCGKIIVATSEQEFPWLETLYERGTSNGLAGIRRLDPVGIRELEPHAAGLRGLHVPETGIVDFKQVAEKLHDSVLSLGGEVRLGETVQALRTTAGGIEVATSSASYHAAHVVNCAGLHSDRIARQTKADLDVRIIPFRGEYYTLRPERLELVRNLIYPVPDPAFPFLGVHFTRMINGGVEAGPNAVLAFKREGYRRLDFSLQDTLESLAWPGLRILARRYWREGAAEQYRSLCKGAFVSALQKLVPEIRDADLSPGGAGVRAQACDRQGRLVDDFYFVRGPGVLHVCNAPSPAATAALAIGEHIRDALAVDSW